MSEEDWEYLLNQMDDNSDWLLIGEWERFGLVWEWATKQVWWLNFLEWTQDGLQTIWCQEIAEQLIHPTRFPQLVTDFLREKEGK